MPGLSAHEIVRLTPTTHRSPETLHRRRTPRHDNRISCDGRFDPRETWPSAPPDQRSRLRFEELKAGCRRTGRHFTSQASCTKGRYGNGEPTAAPSTTTQRTLWAACGTQEALSRPSSPRGRAASSTEAGWPGGQHTPRRTRQGGAAGSRVAVRLVVGVGRLVSPSFSSLVSPPGSSGADLIRRPAEIWLWCSRGAGQMNTTGARDCREPPERGRGGSLNQ